MGIYNVRQPPYNAVGDGRNETSILKQAMTDARNAGGGEVYLPAAIYGIEGNIFDSFNGSFVGSRVTIRGDGPSATNINLRVNVGSTTPIFKVYGGSFSNRASWFELRDLTLNGNNKTATWLGSNLPRLRALSESKFAKLLAGASMATNGGTRSCMT